MDLLYCWRVLWNKPWKVYFKTNIVFFLIVHSGSCKLKRMQCVRCIFMIRYTAMMKVHLSDIKDATK